MKIEEKELGARPHRMVELYALMAEIYDEVKKKCSLSIAPNILPPFVSLSVSHSEGYFGILRIK